MQVADPDPDQRMSFTDLHCVYNPFVEAEKAEAYVFKSLHYLIGLNVPRDLAYSKPVVLDAL